MASADFESAAELTGQEDTCVNLITAKQHIALNPKFIGQIAKGIREELNGQLNLYSDRLEGVPIAFGNITCSKSYANILDEQPFLHLDCQAEAVVFQPTLGSRLTGSVNKLGHDHVGCLVHHVFNVAIHRPRAATETWVGADLTVGQEVVIEVTKLQIFNGVVSIRGNIVEVRAYSNDDVTQETPKSDKKKQKKKKKESLSGRTTANQNESEMAHSYHLSLTTTKDNENESIGSLDSGLGASTPPPERFVKTNEGTKQAKALATPDNIQIQANQSLNETSALEESVLHDDASSTKKKKKKKRKESFEHNQVSDKIDSAYTAVVGNDSTSSAVTNLESFQDGASSSNKKKKKKRTLETPEQKENYGLSITSNTSVDSQNPPIMDTSLVKSDIPITDSAPSSSKKKKSKKSRSASDVHQHHVDILGQNVSSNVPVNPQNESFLDTSSIKSEHFTLDIPTSKKKRKHKKSLDTLELQPSVDSIDPNFDHLGSDFEFPTDPGLSLSSSKKKKKSKRKDSMDGLPIQTFDIKTEEVPPMSSSMLNQDGGSDDNIASLPVSSFHMNTMPAATVKVEPQHSSGESSKKKKRKRKHSETMPVDITGSNDLSELSPPVKKKKKKKHSLP